LNIFFAFGEACRIPSELVVETVWRVGGTSDLQRGKVDHVVPAITDAPEMAFPVLGVSAHKLANNREDRERRQWQWPAFQGKSWCNIDVVDWSLLLLGLRGAIGFGQVVGQIGKFSICGVEGIGTGFVNGNGNLNGAIEIGDKPGWKCQYVF